MATELTTLIVHHSPLDVAAARQILRETGARTTAQAWAIIDLASRGYSGKNLLTAYAQRGFA